MSTLTCKTTLLPIPDTGRERQIVHLRHTHEVERGEYQVELVTYTLGAAVFCSPACAAVYLLRDVIAFPGRHAVTVPLLDDAPCITANAAAEAKRAAGTLDEEPF